MLFKLLSDYKPKGVAVAWDSRPTERAAIAQAGDVVYKEGRQGDAGSPPRAVPALPADRRGVRLPEPRVRGLGGRRRDRHARHPRRRGRDQDDGRLHRPRRLPALLAEHRADDDAAGRRRRQRLHARARRAALRRPARPGARLHRPQGRHVGQHPGRPRNRRQDRGPADRAVRLARGGDRARRRALAGAPEEHHRVRRPGADVEGARHDAPRPRPRLRPVPDRARAARPLAAPGDVPPLRVPGAAEPDRGPRGRDPVRRARARGRHDRPLARGRAAAGARPCRDRDRGRPLRARAGRRRRRRPVGRQPPAEAAAGAARRARLQGAAAADDGARRRHDDRRLPDRARPLRVRDRRPPARVRPRGDSRARRPRRRRPR